MKNISKLTSAVGASVLVLTSFSPALAESTTTKDESVYVILNADGTVSSVTVSDKLHNDDGFDHYEDTSDLTDVQNLKSDDEIEKNDTGYTWTTDDTDVYYQGKSDASLPLETTISYELDGKQVDADEMGGKSGHLKMTINVTNTQTQEYTVNGVTYTVAKPFYTVVGGMFDNETFKNLTIDHGMTQDDSSSNIAVAVMMPGLKDSLGQLLTGDLSSLNDYLFDTITIEADVTDFSSPTLMMAASTDLSALKDEIKDDNLEGTDIFSQLDELDEATQKLIDGSKTLYDGASELNDGASQLNDGASTLLDGTATLSDGVGQLVDGTSTLKDGANQLSTGAASLEAGLAQLVSNNETLVNGANTIADAVLSTAQSTLRTQLKDDSITLTWDNYATVLGDYNNVNDDMRATAKQTIRSAVEAQTGALDDSTFNGILYLCAANGCQDATSISNVLQANASNLATAQQISGLSSEVVATLQQDYSYVTSVLNLAVYESGLSQVKSAVSDATSNTVTLTDAQAEAILLQVIQGNVDLTNPDLTSLQQLIASIPSDQAKKGPLDASVKPYVDALRSSKGDATVYQAVCQTLSKAGVTDAQDQATLMVIAGQLHSDSTSLLDASTGAFTLASQDAQVAKTIQNAITKGNDTTDTASQNLITGMLNSLALPSLETELAKVSTQLNQVASFKAGIKSYTDGVATVYAGSQQLTTGLSSLTTGIDTLASGIDKVNSGAKSLNEGASTLKDGTQSLADGATQLSDGAKTLYDGLVEYNEEGISKLTQNTALTNLKTASELIKDIQDDEQYTSYSGVSEGTESTVKFIYKISSVKKEETKDTTSETTTTEEKTSFLDRIVNLFHFGD